MDLRNPELSILTKSNKHEFDDVLNSLLNSIGNSFLTKCLIQYEDNENEYKHVQIKFTKCWLDIFEELFYHSTRLKKSPFVSFLHSSLQDFHSKHVCSIKTALCLTILLWKRFKALTNVNCLQVSKLIRHSFWVINKSIQLVKREKLKHLPLELDEKQDAFINKLFMDLSRNQTEFAKILFELFRFHRSEKIEFKFENILITTTTKTIYNQKSNSDLEIDSTEFQNGLLYKILDGIAIHFDSKTANYSIINDNFNCLFINASLRSDYVHLGFNKNIQFNKFHESSSDSESMPFSINWQNRLKKILIAHQIKVLFVRDQIDKSLIEFFQSNSILYFSNLPKRLNKHLKLLFKCEPLVFMEDFGERNVFKAKCEQFTFNQQTYLSFKCSNPNADSARFFSLILESKLPSTNTMNKEFLLHCLKRVENVLRTQCYLDESIEFYLSEMLRNRNFLYDPQDSNKFNEEDVVHIELIKQTLSDVFKDFYLIVQSNQPDHNEPFYDDFEGKMNSWLFAFKNIKTLLNTDFSIAY